MLESNIRQIAIQAIAARASGSPVEAAEQILAGIAALDSPGKPFVIWPSSLRPLEQIEALELELKRVRRAHQGVTDYWAMRESLPPAGLGARLEHQTAQSRPEASGALVAGTGIQPAPDEAAEEASAQLALRPDRGANDASQ